MHIKILKNALNLYFVIKKFNKYYYLKVICFFKFNLIIKVIFKSNSCKLTNIEYLYNLI